jgi:hypothetical protein
MHKERDAVSEAKLLAEMRGERMHPSGLYESEMRSNAQPNRKARRASKLK